MYSKGANVLHTLRQICQDDEKWRKILRGLNKEFYHKTVTTQEIENYISENMNYDLTKFFDQYLRDFRVPTLEYFIEDGVLNYRWINVINDFKMPVELLVNEKQIYIEAESSYKKLKIDSDKIKISNDYYVFSQKI